MSARDCAELLQWALPRLSMQWTGFVRVRAQVCKRIARRASALGLDDMAAYRRHLEANADEWAVLDGLCRVTISRFFRDRWVFERLRTEVLPDLAELVTARGEHVLRVWSAGSASGEEPYSLAMLWHFELAPRFPEVALEIVATDVDEQMLVRARRGCYERGSLRELPPSWYGLAFHRQGGTYCVHDWLKEAVDFRCHDVRAEPPAGGRKTGRGPVLSARGPATFHLVLCRNLVFTYFDESLQRQFVERLGARMPEGGIVVLGRHEHLPPGSSEFELLDPAHRHQAASAPLPTPSPPSTLIAPSERESGGMWKRTGRHVSR